MKLYRVPATCHVCGKKFMARYNVADRAKVCTPPSHKCTRGVRDLPSGKRRAIVCVEACCRSKYAKSITAAMMDNAIDMKKVLSDAEFKSVVLETRKTADTISSALRFIAATGCRLGEALLVKSAGVEFRTGKLSIVKIPTLKRGGRPVRTVFILNGHWITSELRKLVKERKPSDLLFKVARRSLQRRMEEILVKHKPHREGLVHIFRHTKASQLIAAGADWQFVRQQLGWSSLEMAKRYVHTSEDTVAKVLDKIGG